MARGQVNTNNLNLSQGQIDEIERQFLFVGVATKNAGSVLYINGQSDLDEVLGVADNELKTVVSAAQKSGGENWQAVVAPQQANYDLAEVLPAALEAYQVEGLAVTTPIADKAALMAASAIVEAQQTNSARRLFATLAAPGIAADQSWTEYLAAIAPLVNGAVAPRVCVVPQLHGNDQGGFMGRLANRSFSIADSPMKTQGGAIQVLGETPTDKDGKPLEESTLIAIEQMGFTTVQHYTDFPGTYWTDGNMLDVPGGDFRVIEHLRILDKAARQIRILQINQIANRSFNNTVTSIESNTTMFMKPLRDMAKSTQVKGVEFPGEIEKPVKGDVVITWQNKYESTVHFSLTPVGSPKKLTANIALDLSA